MRLVIPKIFLLSQNKFWLQTANHDKLYALKSIIFHHLIHICSQMLKGLENTMVPLPNFLNIIENNSALIFICFGHQVLYKWCKIRIDIKTQSIHNSSGCSEILYMFTCSQFTWMIESTAIWLSVQDFCITLIISL